MEESIFVGEHSDGSRKRPRNKNLRARRKEARYRDSDPALLAFNPPCTHTTKRYSCCLISMNYLIYAKQKMYDAHTKIEQDRRLSYMLRVSGTKRSRPVAKPKTKSRNAKKFSVKYYIPVKQGKMMPVCAKCKEEWQDNGELEYYKKIINSDGDGVTDSDQEQQEMCDCLEEEDEISKF